MFIIPERLKSKRFPNKILAHIIEIPMVVIVDKIEKEVDNIDLKQMS